MNFLPVENDAMYMMSVSLKKFQYYQGSQCPKSNLYSIVSLGGEGYEIEVHESKPNCLQRKRENNTSWPFRPLFGIHTKMSLQCHLLKTTFGLMVGTNLRNAQITVYLLLLNIKMDGAHHSKLKLLRKPSLFIK